MLILDPRRWQQFQKVVPFRNYPDFYKRSHALKTCLTLRDWFSLKLPQPQQVLGASFLPSCRFSKVVRIVAQGWGLAPAATSRRRKIETSAEVQAAMRASACAVQSFPQKLQKTPDFIKKLPWTALALLSPTSESSKGLGVHLFCKCSTPDAA